MARTGDATPVTWEAVRRLALALPGVEEGVAYGTPSLRVRARFLGRLHEDGEALVLYVDPDARDALAEADPVTFEVTDHLRAHPYVRVRLATVSRGELGALLEAAWRLRAPRRLVAAHDDAQQRTVAR